MLSTTSNRALLLATLALLSTLLGCNDGPRPPFRIEVVNAQGQSPILGAALGHLDVTVTQGSDVRRARADLLNGTFQLDLAIPSYTAYTNIDVELVRDGVTMYGSTANMVPLGIGYARVPVVAAGTCERIATQQLGTPRASHAVVMSDFTAVAVGGIRGDGAPTQVVETWRAPQLTSIDANLASLTLAQAVGRVRALTFYQVPRVLVVASSRVSILDLNAAPSPSADLVPTGLHAGAGDPSALVDLITGGVLLVGPGTNASWITLERAVTSSVLPEARDQSTGTLLATSHILVAGGNADGNSLGGLIPLDAADRNNVVSFGPTDARRGGWLAPSPDRRSALYVGSRDATDTLTPETFLITGCPGACTVRPGPMWNEARENATFVDGPDGTTWILGGLESAASVSTVERIDWDGATPRFTTSGALNTPRESAAAVHLAGGMILISGGRNGATMLSDFELCAPSSR